MSIELVGPNWPSIQALREDLRRAPENGRYVYGLRKLGAIEQLEALQEAGVQTPEFTESVDTALTWTRSGSIVFGRRLRHSQGRDIIVASRDTIRGSRHFQRWQQRQWWSRYAPSISEWRLHVFDGLVIARGLKYFAGNAGPLVANATAVPEVVIRSRSRGWLMRHDADPPRGLRKIAKAAVEALRYPRGAVDMLVTTDRVPTKEHPLEITEVIVLEVNLMPAMDNYTRTAHVEAIRRKVRG